MSDLLDAVLAPHARMAEIRRLVLEAADLAVQAGRADLGADYALCDTLWQRHDSSVAELLEHLQRAEERGELAECEAMLTVSFGGRA